MGTIVNKREAIEALKTNRVQYKFKNMGDWQTILQKNIPDHVTDEDYQFQILDLDIKAGQIWLDKVKHAFNTQNPDKKDIHYSAEIKVLAFAEDYVMYKEMDDHAIPEVLFKNDFLDRFQFSEGRITDTPSTPKTYFSYDFDGEGITFHDSLEKAKKDTEANLDHYRDHVASGYHVDNDGNFNDVCYGVVLGRAAYNVEAKVTLEHHEKGEYKDYAVGTEILSLFIKDE